MKKEISKTEYLQLQGLSLVGKNLGERLEDIVTSFASVIDEELEGNYGHSADFIYSDGGLDSFLSIHGIKVKKVKK